MSKFVAFKDLTTKLGLGQISRDDYFFGIEQLDLAPEELEDFEIAYNDYRKELKAGA